MSLISSICILCSPFLEDVFIVFACMCVIFLSSPTHIFHFLKFFVLPSVRYLQSYLATNILKNFLLSYLLFVRSPLLFSLMSAKPVST